MPEAKADFVTKTSHTQEETLAWLRKISGELSTTILKRLEETLPWYEDMAPARRSALGLVAQAGISSFIEWYEDPGTKPWVAANIFNTAPHELLRSVSLQQTLQMIRVVIEVVEKRLGGARGDLREAILVYSRDRIRGRRRVRARR